MRLQRHKYSAKSTVCFEGHRHPSKVEAGYCNNLRLLVKAKEIYCYEYERRFPLEVNGMTIGHHKPDFCVYKTQKDFDLDAPEIHEIKGAMTVDWNLRRKLFEAIYPHLEYIVIR